MKKQFRILIILGAILILFFCFCIYAAIDYDAHVPKITPYAEPVKITTNKKVAPADLALIEGTGDFAFSIAAQWEDGTDDGIFISEDEPYFIVIKGNGTLIATVHATGYETRTCEVRCIVSPNE